MAGYSFNRIFNVFKPQALVTVLPASFSPFVLQIEYI